MKILLYLLFLQSKIVLADKYSCLHVTVCVCAVIFHLFILYVSLCFLSEKHKPPVGHGKITGTLFIYL